MSEGKCSDLKKYPIRLAFLHQAVSVLGCINTERTLSNDKVPGIKMTYTQDGLFVEAKGARCIIPLANVCVAVLE